MQSLQSINQVNGFSPAKFNPLVTEDVPKYANDATQDDKTKPQQAKDQFTAGEDKADEAADPAAQRVAQGLQALIQEEEDAKAAKETDKASPNGAEEAAGEKKAENPGEIEESPEDKIKDVDSAIGDVQSAIDTVTQKAEEADKEDAGNEAAPAQGAQKGEQAGKAGKKEKTGKAQETRKKAEEKLQNLNTVLELLKNLNGVIGGDAEQNDVPGASPSTMSPVSTAKKADAVTGASRKG